MRHRGKPPCGTWPSDASLCTQGIDTLDPLGDGLYELFVQHCGSAPAVGMQALGLGQLFPNLVRALNEDISSAVPSTSGAPPAAPAAAPRLAAQQTQPPARARTHQRPWPRQSWRGPCLM